MEIARRTRRTRARGAAHRLAEADLTVLGDRLDQAEHRLQGAVVSDDVEAHVVAAREAHAEARHRLVLATTPDALVGAVAVLAAGRQHLAHVEAYVVGDDAPEERSPCFFDPAHGPSVTDAAWTTVRFGTRRVPACLRDTVLLAAGVPPDPRIVEVHGRRVPYWAAGEEVAPYLDGYFAAHPLLTWLRHPGNPLPKGIRRPPGVYGEANTYSPSGF